MCTGRRRAGNTNMLISVFHWLVEGESLENVVLHGCFRCASCCGNEDQCIDALCMKHDCWIDIFLIK